MVDASNVIKNVTLLPNIQKIWVGKIIFHIKQLTTSIKCYGVV
jgi:hypothetical protein